MTAPTDERQWLIMGSVDSTNAHAAAFVREFVRCPKQLVLARHQTHGRGRFDRRWHSEKDASLAMSWIAEAYADHPKPWLVGMAVAAAAAGALHCRLQWPNDLVLDGKKLGGILTEIAHNPNGEAIPIIGVGVNLTTTTFPAEIEPIATSLALHRPGDYDALDVARAIIKGIEMMPEPESWQAIQPEWSIFDTTPGKRYRLNDGIVAFAIGIGSSGELLCSVDGETQSVMAAEALFGIRP